MRKPSYVLRGSSFAGPSNGVMQHRALFVRDGWEKARVNVMARWGPDLAKGAIDVAGKIGPDGRIEQMGIKLADNNCRNMRVSILGSASRRRF